MGKAMIIVNVGVFHENVLDSRTARYSECNLQRAQLAFSLYSRSLAKKGRERQSLGSS